MRKFKEDDRIFQCSGASCCTDKDCMHHKQHLHNNDCGLSVHRCHGLVVQCVQVAGPLPLPTPWLPDDDDNYRSNDYSVMRYA